MNDYIHRAIGTLHSECLALKAERSNAPPDQHEELDAAVKALHDAATSLIVFSGERDRAIQNRKSWQELLPKCRQAKTRLAILERDYERSHARKIEHQNAALLAESQLGQVMQQKPRAQDYPSQKDFDHHAAQVERFRVVFEEVKAAGRMFAEEQGTLVRSLLVLREEFRLLELQEYRLRPRSEQTEGLSVRSFG